MKFSILAAIGAGSAAGGIARYVLGALLQQRIGGAFPAGTLVINVTGSFALGFLLRYALGSPAVSVETRALLTTGFCGGYTTFSTFSYETLLLAEEGQAGRAASYVTLSVVLSLAAAYIGLTLARAMLALRQPA